MTERFHHQPNIHTDAVQSHAWHTVDLTVLHTSNIWIYSLLLPLHLIVCLRSVEQDVFWNVYLTFIFVLPWAVHYVGQLSRCKFHWQAVATWTSICPETMFCLSSLDIGMRSCWLKLFETLSINICLVHQGCLYPYTGNLHRLWLMSSLSR